MAPYPLIILRSYTCISVTIVVCGNRSPFCLYLFLGSEEKQEFTNLSEEKQPSQCTYLFLGSSSRTKVSFMTLSTVTQQPWQKRGWAKLEPIKPHKYHRNWWRCSNISSWSFLKLEQAVQINPKSSFWYLHYTAECQIYFLASNNSI